MKKVLLGMVMACASFTAHAQSNSILVYGGLGINSAKSSSDVKTNTFHFPPV